MSNAHPYYENCHALYEKRPSQLRVKDIFTTSKEVKKCLNFLTCGAYFFQLNYIFPKLLRKISKFSPNLYPFNLIIVLHQCSPLMHSTKIIVLKYRTVFISNVEDDRFMASSLMAVIHNKGLDILKTSTRIVHRCAI